MTEHIGYIRVSTVVQNTERQLLNIELDKTFTDKCNGKDTNRPELKQLISYARLGDVIHGKIRELFSQGVNKSQIAKQLGCTRPTVYKALK